MNPMELAQAMRMQSASPVMPVGDVVQGPWGQQRIEQGVPIVPGMPGASAPGAVAPPPPGGNIAPMPRSAGQIREDLIKSLNAAPGAPTMRDHLDAVRGQSQVDPKSLADFLKGTPDYKMAPMSQAGAQLEKLRPDLRTLMKGEQELTKWASSIGMPVDKALRAAAEMRAAGFPDSQIKYTLAAMWQTHGKK
jgi:hypothetical protein